MRRRRAALIASAVAVGVVVVAGAWALFLRGGSGNGENRRNGDAAVDISRGAELADEACDAFNEAERLIRANAKSDDVLALTERARARAETAAEEDPTWRPLAGGTAALDESLRADDPTAARVGVDVVRSECERVTAGPPPSGPDERPSP